LADRTTFPAAPAEADTLEILRRIRADDERGWDELYRRYHDPLLFAVRARMGPRLRAALESEDVFQSVALAALRALPRFEYRGPGSLLRYLRRLVANKIRDRADSVRAQKRRGAVPLDEVHSAEIAASAPPPAYAAGERYERLERCLAQLPPDFREVILLRKVDGLSSREAAQRLGRSDEATRKLYSRALARLSALMAEYEPP
jgi:RNA polymerase sigma-70 factor (ECF subfamily)